MAGLLSFTFYSLHGFLFFWSRFCNFFLFQFSRGFCFYSRVICCFHFQSFYWKCYSGIGLCVAANDRFAFTAHDYSHMDLTAAEHDCELARDPDTVWLTIDAVQSGLGSNSCGPEPLQAYRLIPEPVRLSLLIKPYGNGLHDAFRLAAHWPETGEDQE